MRLLNLYPAIILIQGIAAWPILRRHEEESLGNTGWGRRAEIRLPGSDSGPWFSNNYWNLYWKKFPDRVPAMGATPEECMNNYRDFMVRAGDLDGRRGIYVRSHCEKLHGLEREALKHAEFAGGWNNVSPAPDTIELPEYQGRPYFHSDYWDLYWKKFPDQVPSKGNTPEECMNNYKDFIMKAGDTDSRRASYIRGLCQKLYDLKAGELRDVEFATGWQRVSFPSPSEDEGPSKFSSKYWKLYWMKFPDKVPDKGATPKECLNNYQDFIIKAGDNNGLRGNYVRFLCAKLHGLKKDALATAEFDKDWEGRPMMGPGTKLPPKAPFSGKYWESYWKKYPHLMPEIGNDVQECERNFMEYIQGQGDWDGRRSTYIKTKCKTLHDLAENEKAPDKMARLERKIAADDRRLKRPPHNPANQLQMAKNWITSHASPLMTQVVQTGKQLPQDFAESLKYLPFRELPSSPGNAPTIAVP